MHRSLEAVRARPELMYSAHVVTFNQQQIQRELAWIAELMQEAAS
jgi:hypothetical protein